MQQAAGIGNRRRPLDPAGRLIMRSGIMSLFTPMATGGKTTHPWAVKPILTRRATGQARSREDEKFTINHPKFAWRPWNWRMLGD